MATIKVGMARDEVRSLLGEPYLTGACGGDEWDYKCNPAGGARFRVFFGPDNRVTERFWWLD
jgi:outer membrane protein assembly factor BamE (lipoprotein component of BamABCDE complex)